MKQSVTLEDVATASGCSTATASLALRNKPGVSRATRVRVLAAAQSLGYQRVSTNLEPAEVASLDIAVIFRTWSEDSQFRKPSISGFYSWVLTGVQEGAANHGAHVLIDNIPVNERNDIEAFPDRLLQKQLDGILLVGSFQEEVLDRVFEQTASYRPPIVLVDNSDLRQRFDSIETANTGGGRTATQHLIDRGHRRIAWFGPTSTWEPNYQARRAGYLSVLEAEGISPAGIFEQEPAGERAMQAAHQALAEATDATAFICANDIFALALLRTARQSGKSIPDDLSIIGFDDLDPARDAEPPLATMAVDKLGLGRHAMYALMHRRSRPESPPMRIEIQPQLLERGTVRTLSQEKGNGRT